MSTTENVIGDLDRYILSTHARGYPDDAAILESIRTRIAALVEAARVFNLAHLFSDTDGRTMVLVEVSVNDLRELNKILSK